MSGIKLQKNALLVIYKLLGDALFLVLGFFFLSLIADGIIPGIVTDHISFLKIIILIVLNLASFYIVGFFAEINAKTSQLISNKKTALFLATFGGLLIFNSLIKLNLYLAFFILAIAMIAGYFLFKNIFENY